MTCVWGKPRIIPKSVVNWLFCCSTTGRDEQLQFASQQKKGSKVSRKGVNQGCKSGCCRYLDHFRTVWCESPQLGLLETRLRLWVDIRKKT